MNRVIIGALAAVVFATPAKAREQINIVGSSTVFPFSTAVAEKFGNQTKYPTPKVESTGSGGGLKLFCKGKSDEHPDIANASRRIKAKEVKACKDNRVGEIAEVMFGYDGIVVGQAKTATDMKLTRANLYDALVVGTNAQKWSDVNPALPSVRIQVLGPPPTSGTRDAFMELVMQKECKHRGLKDCKKITLRSDGAWIDSGENDNLIVNKLLSNKAAVGVFGFSFLDQNKSKIKGISVNGVDPTFENIADGKYAISRSLYFYVKFDRFKATPGLLDFYEMWKKPSVTGPDGFLVDKGLIPAEKVQIRAF